MPDIAEVWSEALPQIKQAVTGVGVWTALNAAQPVAMEDDVFVLGVDPRSSELAGHLKLAATHRLMEQVLSRIAGRQLNVRVISGTEAEDWETVKRRDAEAKRLHEQALQKARSELEARTSWDSIYEQLGRSFAAIANKSLPQNRAQFYHNSVQLLADVRRKQESTDEFSERNFARCIERVSQLSEVPSVIVALYVLQLADEA